MSPSSTTPAATRAAHPSISIFEIPLILDLICTHLSKNHLQSCLQVSHLWHDLFHPHIFHHVRFADLTPHQTWTVLNHSPHRIQSLTIDLADASLFIRPPPLTSSSSNNSSRPWIKNKNNSLQVLHCVGFGRSFARILSSDLMFLNLSLSLEDQANSALLLIQSSPHLHTLLIDHIPIANASSYFTTPVLKTISQHRTLKTIKIHLLFVPWMFLSNLIISLPEGIQELDLCFENYWYIRRSSMPPILKIPDTRRLLPALERICLRGLHQRVDSHWYLGHNYAKQHQQQQSPTPTSSSQHYIPTSDMTNIETRVLPLLQTTPHLSHLILREYNSSLRKLLQSLVICCPNLITIELSTYISEEMYEYLDYPGNNDSSSQLAIQGSFARLKEFRVEGNWTNRTSRMMVGLVARSKDTLEIAWFDRCNWDRLESGCVNDSAMDSNDTWLEYTTSDAGEDQQEDDEGVLTIDNPFCINADASWTHCTRLKELVLYKPSGYLLSNDDRRRDLFLSTSSTSPTSSPSTNSGTTEGYPSPFTQLEKLKLSIRELHWQDCPEEYHGTQKPTPWTSSPSSSSCPKPRIHGQEKREHQLGFILQVRNLFGFLKIYYPRLQYLNIEWCACPLIQDMSLDYAMRLFCQTERSEINNNNNNIEGWCWWGKVTEQDLQWLCLPWSSLSSLLQSKVSTDMTAACRQQYANKSQFLLASTDPKVTPTNTSDYSNSNNDSDDSWPLGEIYTCRVGRAWKDSLSLSTHDDFPGHSGSTCRRKKMGYHSNDYHQPESTTTMCACDWSTELKYAVEGLALAKESGRSGKKRILRGAASYRQSVIGKHNQIK